MSFCKSPKLGWDSAALDDTEFAAKGFGGAGPEVPAGFPADTELDGDGPGRFKTGSFGLIG